MVLEVGCGSDATRCGVAEKTGCRVTGVDINAHGIRNANALVHAGKLDSLVRFAEEEVSKGLAFDDGTFEAAFANDVICHIPERDRVLAEVFRVRKPGRRNRRYGVRIPPFGFMGPGACSKHSFFPLLRKQPPVKC
jgi:ubiquinone/menaquinone biosynthesis C-methylase UbiE